MARAAHSLESWFNRAMQMRDNKAITLIGMDGTGKAVVANQEHVMNVSRLYDLA